MLLKIVSISKISCVVSIVFSFLRTANLLSKFLKLNNGTLDKVNEELFFLFVRNNVHGDSLIFGSAIALERGVYRYSIPSCADLESFIRGVPSKEEGKYQESIQSQPHMTQDTNWKLTNSQLDVTNESQKVSPYPAGDHKALVNRHARKHNKNKTEIT